MGAQEASPKTSFRDRSPPWLGGSPDQRAALHLVSNVADAIRDRFFTAGMAGFCGSFQLSESLCSVSRRTWLTPVIDHPRAIVELLSWQCCQARACLSSCCESKPQCRDTNVKLRTASELLDHVIISAQVSWEKAALSERTFPRSSPRPVSNTPHI